MKTHLHIVERLFQSWHSLMGRDYDGYRHHVYRVVNLTHALYPSMSAEDADLLEVAAAFHDAGIWLNGTFDYIDPSADHASAWLARHPDLGQSSLESLQRRVRKLIHTHHQITPVRDDRGLELLADAFRRADWLDVTGLAWVPAISPLSRAQRKAMARQFPDRGFHRLLLVKAFNHACENPRNPLPMLRW